MDDLMIDEVEAEEELRRVSSRFHSVCRHVANAFNYV